ncbi:MAG: hypothetical protein K6B69_16140 [Lachnospiraceae bacterium]|nr:hypothetical protein [Lachnospiraceae bacterium]MCR5129620.1 hypothetical protein [Lachnospiraceae bacterium]
MKRDGHGVFLVLLLVSVLLVIYFAVTSASKELKEYQETQDQISANQEEVEEMGEAMQEIKNQIEDGYDQLDKQIADE